MYQSKKILNLQKFREFNEYVVEKVESISRLFGTRVTRNETINEDEYQYIRPYKKQLRLLLQKCPPQCLQVQKIVR